MKPKPWQSKPRPITPNISQVIQSNPTIKEETPKISAEANLNGVPPASTVSTAASSPASSYGGMSGGYGGYGGYGGMSSYGGMGSMYGGMGSMYGMGMGMGMGGMYGMGGMGMDQKGALFNSMIALQSFGFLINSLCEIARSLDQNYEGLKLFKESFTNLYHKLISGIKNMFIWIGTKIANLFLAILHFIKHYVLCLGQTQNQSKLQKIRLMVNLLIVAVLISLYPNIKSKILQIKAK